MIFIEHPKPIIVRTLSALFGAASVVVAHFFPQHLSLFSELGAFLIGTGLITVQDKK